MFCTLWPRDPDLWLNIIWLARTRDGLPPWQVWWLRFHGFIVRKDCQNRPGSLLGTPPHPGTDWQPAVLMDNYRLVGWLSDGRTSVSDRQTFAGLHRTCSWWVTIYMGKPSAVGQPTRPTQPFILSHGVDKWVVSFISWCYNCSFSSGAPWWTTQ